MSATTDLERALATWLEQDGPADVPEHVIATALAEARPVRQRRAWLTTTWLATRASRNDAVTKSTETIDRVQGRTDGGPLSLVWIVALVGLLAAAAVGAAVVGSGLLRPPDRLSVVVPVPESSSPAPTAEPPSGTVAGQLEPAEELPSAMVAEQVEPGVFHVTSDGVRDLASVEAVDIVAGYDDGIWLLRADEFSRLGSEGSHAWPMGSGPNDRTFEVAPDGTMWVMPPKDGTVLRSTDGEEWTAQPCPEGSTECTGFTVAPDGSVWVSWAVGDSPFMDGVWRVSHLGPSGWQALDGDTGVSWLDRFFVTDAGDLYGGVCDWGCWLARYENGAWELRGTASRFDVGPDGTVWSPDSQGLARLADGEWERWAAADFPDILRFDRSRPSHYEFEVAPDGSLWFSVWGAADDDPLDVDSLECDGLARFDGETLDRFLPGQCVSMDIAADGSVWVLATDDAALGAFSPWGGFLSDQTCDLYLITREAVATSG